MNIYSQYAGRIEEYRTTKVLWVLELKEEVKMTHQDTQKFNETPEIKRTHVRNVRYLLKTKLLIDMNI